MNQDNKAGFAAVVVEDYRRRPLWMNLIFYFCLFMTFIFMPFDMLFKRVAQDHEIWFGLTLTGWWAKATEPLHWLIYGLGAYGFRHMKPWMWPWAGVYAAQVVIAMVVWNLVNPRGGGLGARPSGVALCPSRLGERAPVYRRRRPPPPRSGAASGARRRCLAPRRGRRARVGGEPAA